MKQDEISRFKGKYFFLSNFHRCQIEYGGLVYPSVENAYQAAKVPKKSRMQFVLISPEESKRLSRKIGIRKNWEEVKIKIMKKLLRKKFAIPDFRELLLETKDMKIIEGNWWFDTFWGVCNGKGQNTLGKLIMEIREEIRNEETNSNA